MPQKEQRRSEMWWRGHNDALAGDPPNESYYHYYYDYKVAYNQTRREQRRTHRQRMFTHVVRRMWFIVPVLLVLGGLAYYGMPEVQPEAEAVTEAPTATTRPTPRPTLTPSRPTPTPEPMLQIDGLAVVTGTNGAPLRARERPGTGADVTIVTRFQEGQQVRLLEGPESANDMEWWRVEANGQSGWAAAPYLQPVESEAAP